MKQTFAILMAWLVLAACSAFPTQAQEVPHWCYEDETGVHCGDGLVQHHLYLPLVSAQSE